MAKHKQIKRMKLNSRDLFLLNSLSESRLASVFFASVKTIQLWKGWGLPYFTVNGDYYYNYDEIWDWLNAPSKEDKNKTNNTVMWERTPEYLLPQAVTLINFKNVKPGDYWLVPVDSKEEGGTND
jgi:hypothetical protein